MVSLKTALARSLAHPTAEFRRTFEVNTFGSYYFARALARSWLGEDIAVGAGSTGRPAPRQLGKQILFISSISAIVAMSPQRQMAYNASKAAVTMMSKSLAVEWASLGITVNSISPGYVATDMIANPPDETAKAWATEWTQRTPVGRYVKQNRADADDQALQLLRKSESLLRRWSATSRVGWVG